MAKQDTTYTKVITQYTHPLPDETLEFLRGISTDYCKVKNVTYERFSGIRHMNSLKPVYNTLNEMRHCGLRKELNLPVVYYELAVADAVTDIRTMWGILKNRIRDRIKENENLTEDDRHYIRLVLKNDSIFAAILNGEPYEQLRNAGELSINEDKLNSLLRRLVRQYRRTPHMEQPGTFKVSPLGYRYADGGLYLVSRIPRRRVFLPLKDRQQTGRQIWVQVRETDAVISIPVDVEVEQHEDYTNILYAHIGYADMITLSSGHIYGKALNDFVTPETERLSEKNHHRGELQRKRNEAAKNGDTAYAEKITANNLGKKKYEARKQRERERTQQFINRELNRMIAEEKPGQIIITKAVSPKHTSPYQKALRRRLSRSFGGYIRVKLKQKCTANAIELTEINSKGTGSICSACGAEGKRTKEGFVCESCGLRISVALNSAKNIENIMKSPVSMNRQESCLHTEQSEGLLRGSYTR